MKPVWELPLDPSGIEVELDTGTHVRIRPGRPDDRAALMEAFERFSDTSRYNRFFSAKPRLSEALATSLSQVDDEHQLAWAVFDPDQPSAVGDASGLAIASARLFVSADEPGVAEGTLAIVDDYQGRGLGRFLIELLISTAAIDDLEIVRFEVLSTNRAMRALMGKVGAHGAALPDDPTVIRYEMAVPSLEDVDPTVGALYVLLRRVAQNRTGGDD
ncbi:MAG: GNAT family N-acetyltransferase [Actinomycetota bacterium]